MYMWCILYKYHNFMHWMMWCVDVADVDHKVKQSSSSSFGSDWGIRISYISSAQVDEPKTHSSAPWLALLLILLVFAARTKPFPQPSVSWSLRDPSNIIQHESNRFLRNLTWREWLVDCTSSHALTACLLLISLWGHHGIGCVAPEPTNAEKNETKGERWEGRVDVAIFCDARSQEEKTPGSSACWANGHGTLRLCEQSGAHLDAG